MYLTELMPTMDDKNDEGGGGGGDDRLQTVPLFPQDSVSECLLGFLWTHEGLGVKAFSI